MLLLLYAGGFCSYGVSETWLKMQDKEIAYRSPETT